MSQTLQPSPSPAQPEYNVFNWLMKAAADIPQDVCDANLGDDIVSILGEKREWASTIADKDQREGWLDFYQRHYHPGNRDGQNQLRAIAIMRQSRESGKSPEEIALVLKPEPTPVIPPSIDSPAEPPPVVHLAKDVSSILVRYRVEFDWFYGHEVAYLNSVDDLPAYQAAVKERFHGFEFKNWKLFEERVNSKEI